MANDDGDAPSALPTPDQVEAKRRAETARKRKYRARKSNELIDLKDESRRLGALLVQLRANDRARLIAQVKEENKRLLLKVNKFHCVMPILSYWAHLNEHPPRAMSNQPTWLETTLLANPTSRKQGIRWLSERVYHQACRLLPENHPVRGQIDDACYVKTNVSDELDEEGLTIASFEAHVQRTVFTNFQSAARAKWDSYLVAKSTVSNELIDRVGDRFLYRHLKSHRIGTNTLSISGFFEDKNCVVITHCFLTRDDIFPIGDDILRNRGFAWTVYEAVAPDITLVHNVSMHCTPITSNGKVIPLHMIGRLFGVPPDGVQFRESYIERVRSAAEAFHRESLRPRSMQEASS